MQTLLDSLRKDLDAVSAEYAVARNRMNEERRNAYRIRREYQKILQAIISLEETMDNA